MPINLRTQNQKSSRLVRDTIYRHRLFLLSKPPTSAMKRNPDLFTLLGRGFVLPSQMRSVACLRRPWLSVVCLYRHVSKSRNKSNLWRLWACFGLTLNVKMVQVYWFRALCESEKPMQCGSCLCGLFFIDLKLNLRYEPHLRFLSHFSTMAMFDQQLRFPKVWAFFCLPFSER